MFRLHKYLLFLTLFFSLVVNSQEYKYLNSLNLDLDYNVKNISNYGFKNVNNFCYILIPEDSTATSISFIQYDLEKEKDYKNISNINGKVILDGLIDFVYLNDMLFYSGPVYRKNSTISALYKYDLNKGKESRVLKLGKMKDFRYLEVLNENLILLYGIYPHHPGDGSAKAQLFLYDINRNKVIREKSIEFEGISLANIVHEWVYVHNGNIYVVSPFSGRILHLDEQLNEKGTYTLDLPDVDFTNSQDIINYWDSLLLLSHEQFNKAKDKDNIHLSFFGKASIYERMSKVREECNYIEKIMHYDDSTFVISLYRPEYQKEFRSLFFINTKTMKVYKTIPKWRSMVPENDFILQRFEDYYTVDLGNNKKFQSFFIMI